MLYLDDEDGQVTTTDNSPLDLHTWLLAFQRLSITLESHSEDDISACIRKAYHLLKLAPSALAPIFSELPDEEDFERLLEQSQAYAASSLLGSAIMSGDNGQETKLDRNSQIFNSHLPKQAEVIDTVSPRSTIEGLCRLVAQLEI